jgi:hypothetical protein
MRLHDTRRLSSVLHGTTFTFNVCVYLKSKDKARPVTGLEGPQGE